MLLVIPALTFFVVQMERGLADQREATASIQPYWDCDPVPPADVLSRTMANTIVKRNWNAIGLAWHGLFAMHSIYYRYRVPTLELRSNYLKTYSSYERNCRRIREWEH